MMTFTIKSKDQEFTLKASKVRTNDDGSIDFFTFSAGSSMELSASFKEYEWFVGSDERKGANND